MKLSTKVRYGLRAMIDLAVQDSDTPVLVQDIAKRQRVSKKYLENLLVTLKASGLVRSVRGAKGGYGLNRPADRITVEDIMVSLDGPVAYTDCASRPDYCDQIHCCAAHELWVKLTQSALKVLRETTLQMLAEREREKQADTTLMYYI